VNAVEIREKLVDTLNLDLIGPERDSPHLAEVLPQAPSRWYLTGFLVPFDASEDQKTDAAGDEGVDEQGESSGSDDSVTPDSAAARRAFFHPRSASAFWFPKKRKNSKLSFAGETTNQLESKCRKIRRRRTRYRLQVECRNRTGSESSV